MRLHINGHWRELDADPAMPLLWALRDHLQLSGTKFGCGAGLCGACTVHLDGQPVRACQTPVARVGQARITTIEGLSADGKHPVQRAWRALNVPQCGYCQAGQMMTAAAHLAQGGATDSASVRAAMAGHICRCGTYARVEQAVALAARLHKEGA
ncbi:(2Fe-2S)-binding protein [Massilia sp. TS11]|uniref:(2Fe-2S)-binding protein n=1 Tax=Massilia sp. TS11 TaxID=2908003 RepID=UPI001EDBD460|nr:(2Fe-2S)-binding protein [Massilia sp. TS11]MCG2585245.1 (2Fe-2S)-binding protein [Massilia sp. TS11]